jgi:hypothetical protein
MIMVRNFKLVLAVMFVLVLIGSTYAFANANTIPVSTAGSGTSTVGGFTVSDIVYDLTDADPTTVDNIYFTVTPPTLTDPEAALAYIQTDATGSWKKDCTLADGSTHATTNAMAVTCVYGTPISLTGITALNVVASSTLEVQIP